jgi:hypothetical protein
MARTNPKAKKPARDNPKAAVPAASPAKPKSQSKPKTAPKSEKKAKGARKGKSAQSRKKSGRPCSYNPEFAEQARKLCEKGFTDYELAQFFEIHRATLYRWMHAHPEFCDAIKTGKEISDERVERTLYEKATGYTFDSEKIFQFKGKVVRAQTVEHIPPDTTAAIFWLKNRRPEQWRDKIAANLNVTMSFEEHILAAIARRDTGRMTAIYCRDCGANLALVGRRHNCRPRPMPAPPAVPAKNANPSPDTPASGAGPTHKSELRKAQTYRWRKRNPDRWRHYHAAYMRTKRADARAPGTRKIKLVPSSTSG